MAQNTKLFLDGVGELDLGLDVPIALNFSVTEIQDISKRSSAFSKTIVLPGTKQNLEKLGFLFNVNVEFADATFDINRKVQAFVFQNDAVVLDGFFKLINVKKLSPSDVSYEQQIEFEAVVFGGQASFFDFVKQYDINSLDLSIYDHTLTWSGITGTTGNTYLDGYKYIWHYCIDDQYNVGDFRPAMFIRTIWDKIFVEAGYSYYMEPNFQTNVFNKLLLPTNTRDLLITREEQLARSCKVGFEGGSTILVGTGGVVDQSPGNGTEPWNIINNSSGIVAPTVTFIAYTQLNFDKDDSCFYNGLYQPFDTTTSIFTTAKNGDYDVTIDMTFEFELEFDVPWGVGPLGPPLFNFIYPKLQLYYDLEFRNPGSSTWQTLQTFSQETDFGDIIPYTPQTFGLSTLDGYPSGVSSGQIRFTTQPIIVSLLQNVELRVMIKAILPTSSLIPANGLTSEFMTTRLNILAGDNAGNCDRSYLRIQAIPGNATEGDIFTLSSCLPQKVKMVDLIKSLATMFNLYIDVDPNDPYRLIVKPRNVYYDYSETEVIDWTKKIDYKQEYSVELLSELQNRTLNFTYKPSKDDVNTNYFEGTKFYYGQYKINFDNDFLTSEQKIEVLFEPTPLVVNGSGGILSDITIGGKPFIVPYLIYGKESLPKILIDGGVIETDQTYFVRGNTTSNGTFEQINFYSYAGHFDQPFTPTIDLNFNVNEEYFYNEITENLTTNNLYNIYWSDYINLISNSRLLTAYVNLNELDIKNLRFDVLYWIEDSYWLLNKVIDYNCNETLLTKCEFIKSINTPFFTTTIEKPDIVRPIKPIKPIKPWVGVPGKDDVRDNIQPGNTANINNGLNSTIKGIRNVISIGSKNVSVLGNGNIVGENIKTGSIIGNDNLIGGDGVDINITGNRNIIGAGSKRVTLINCDDVTILDGANDIFLQNVRDRTITKSDVAFVSPYVYFYQGYRINNSDIVDGGEDIVFDPQNEFVDNVMDGLLDETFMMGVDGAQIIDGTYDSVDF